MLVVKCFGGLGNQMFQYAFYNYLKLDNEDVYFDISDFQIHNHHYGFELDKQLYLSTINRLNTIIKNNNMPSVKWNLYNEDMLFWNNKDIKYVRVCRKV